MRQFVVKSVALRHVSTDKSQNMGEKYKKSLVTDNDTHTEPSAHVNISGPSKA